MRPRHPITATEHRICRAVRRLLDALDRPLSANREVAEARAALSRATARAETVKLAADEEDNSDAD